MRKFDEDKSANRRLKKLKKIVDFYEFDQFESFNAESSEWVVRTNLTVYQKGFKRTSIGLGAMSVNDKDYGWAALPYASTTSLGRAIGLLGILDEDIVTELELEAAAKRLEKKPLSATEFIKETLEKSKKAIDNIASEDIEKEQITNEYFVPQKEFIKTTDQVKEVIPEPVKEVIPEPVIPEPKVKKEEKSYSNIEYVPKKKYSKSELQFMTLPVLEQVAHELMSPLNMSVSDFPGRDTKEKYRGFVAAAQINRVMEYGKDYLEGWMKENVDKGFDPDVDVDPKLITKFGLGHLRPKIIRPDSLDAQYEVIINDLVSVNDRQYPFIKEVFIDPLLRMKFDMEHFTEAFNYSKNSFGRHKTFIDLIRNGTTDEIRDFVSALIKIRDGEI